MYCRVCRKGQKHKDVKDDIACLQFISEHADHNRAWAKRTLLRQIRISNPRAHMWEQKELPPLTSNIISEIRNRIDYTPRQGRWKYYRNDIDD